MEVPFALGKCATKRDFIGRAKETAELADYFTSLTSSVIIAPHHWGKRSLIKKAEELALEKDENLHFSYFSLFNIREEADIEEMNIFELPEKHKDEKFIICIGEFQNVAEFSPSFLKGLYEEFGRHKNVAYCLRGSNRQAMFALFNTPGKPFYRFGREIILDRLSSEEIVKLADNRFVDTGKRIDAHVAQLIATLTENHPGYSQELSHLAWARTAIDCTEEIVEESLEVLTEQYSPFFEAITAALTTQQLYYLKALCSGEKVFTSTEVMYRYKISSPTSVARSKAALLNNGILDNPSGKVAIENPIYAHWLKRKYFNR